MAENGEDTDTSQSSEEEDPIDSQYKYVWKTQSGHKYRFDSVKELLAKVMRHIEKTRNYDYKLKHFVWTQVQEIDPSKEEEFKDAIKGATIERARRKVQKTDQRLLPTKPEVLFDRDFTVAQVQDYYEIKKPQIPHEYLDYLGKKIEQGHLTEEEMEEKYIGDLDSAGKFVSEDEAGITEKSGKHKQKAKNSDTRWNS